MAIDERKITYNGDLFQLTSTVFYSEKTKTVRIFEKAHRPPGVRMLFIKENRILLSREFRKEIDSWDYRLPGGKVFDDFSSYSKFMNDETEFHSKLIEAVRKESKEEVGLLVSTDSVELLHKSISGSSVKWDLFYFKISEFEESQQGQELEEGEQIDLPVWVETDTVIKMCLSGEIREDRSVAVLMRYILNKT